MMKALMAILIAVEVVTSLEKQDYLTRAAQEERAGGDLSFVMLLAAIVMLLGGKFYWNSVRAKYPLPLQN